MPLTWNEIKTRAAAFVHEWRDETREHAEAKTFWDQFLNVFGMSRRRVGIRCPPGSTGAPTASTAVEP